MAETATLPTAEVVRDRVAGDDALPPPAPPQEAAQPSGLTGLAESLLAAHQASQDMRARAAAAMDTKAAEMAPQIEGVQSAQQQMQQEAERRQAEVNARKPVQTPPPSLGLTPFLSPREGEAPEQLVSKFILAAGLFAGGVGGMVAKDARGSLAALKGALEGWQAGDRERADRAFADWKAKAEQALQAWQIERTSYEDWFKTANNSIEQMMSGLTLTALKHDNATAADIFRSASLDKAVSFFQERDKAAREWAETIGKLSKADADAALKGFPEGVRAELMADPEARKQIDAGNRPTDDQIRKAITAVDKRILDRQVESARQQGYYAALIPQRTPDVFIKDLRDIGLAGSQINEMGRLADRIDLSQTIGGLRPWINEMVQTGRAGPFPISATAMGTLNDDQRRFLALVQDYADTVLRMRSGAAINEQEFKRMLGFITEQGITPDTFRSRLALQGDLMRAKGEAVGTLLTSGGYRNPGIVSPSLAPPEPPGPPAPSMPSASGNKDRVLRDTVTGKRYRSNGTIWVPIGG